MIALIDYNMGNLGSVNKALEFVGADVRIIDNPVELPQFDGCLLPGVGNFGDGMEQLQTRGFVEPIRSFAATGKPFFGICLGMQMLLDTSEEAPGVAGIGLIHGKCRRFPASPQKVPQIGWNSVTRRSANPGAEPVRDGDYFYFVHSYYAEVADPADAVLMCDYILPFAAAVGRGNIFATQFHPEKSQANGLRLLEHFVRRSQSK